MPFTRRARSAVAVVTALFMLLCQAAYAAHACMPVGAAQAAAPAAPCHETAGAAQSAPQTAPNVCDAAKAPGDAAKVQVTVVNELPGVSVAYTPDVVRLAQARVQSVHAVCHSPPLTILHCRLLN